jgi:hypothetical protein
MIYSQVLNLYISCVYYVATTSNHGHKLNPHPHTNLRPGIQIPTVWYCGLCMRLLPHRIDREFINAFPHNRAIFSLIIYAIYILSARLLLFTQLRLFILLSIRKS